MHVCTADAFAMYIRMLTTQKHIILLNTCTSISRGVIHLKVCERNIGLEMPSGCIDTVAIMC